jgi:hypothetical protein
MLPAQLPENFAGAILNELQVASEDFWSKVDLPLVSELQRRVSGSGVREIEPGEQAWKLFGRFLVLNSSIRTDPYLQFLCDVTKQEFREYEGHFNEIFASPQIFSERLAHQAWSGLAIERVSVGVCRSFYFLRELLALLEDAREHHPYMADSIRSYNRYWTDLLSSETGQRAASFILDSFERWAQEANDSDALDDIRGLRRAVSQFQFSYA